jgi:hypothetical protein
MGAGGARLAQARRSSRGRVLALAELWEAHRTTRQPSSSPGPSLRHAFASFSHAHVAPCRLRSSTWSSWAQLALECRHWPAAAGGSRRSHALLLTRWTFHVSLSIPPIMSTPYIPTNMPPACPVRLGS